ncbi:hypothetical protein [Actinomadura sp. WMMA1423]|uniref:hypothetical protein n=1 Tax=Actinomadura sp. WMMA1423 TaxID=2591108 RepID=UPI0011464366|nr:hypothetical protein [Actinomadura sp. WMMA1423]
MILYFANAAYGLASFLIVFYGCSRLANRLRQVHRPEHSVTGDLLMLCRCAEVKMSSTDKEIRRVASGRQMDTRNHYGLGDRCFGLNSAVLSDEYYRIAGRVAQRYPLVAARFYGIVDDDYRRWIMLSWIAPGSPLAEHGNNPEITKILETLQSEARRQQRMFHRSLLAASLTPADVENLDSVPLLISH